MGSNSFFKPFLTLLAAVAVLLSAGYVSAQTVTGSIGGSITDQSGAAVSGATITATNLATGVATTTRSDSSGVYNIQFLPIGAYSVSATGTGFQTSTVSSLTLEIDQIARLNFKLQVGSVSTTISVSSESGAALQTQNPTLGTTVSSNTIENLPLSGLNFQTAGMFVPGAVNPTYSSMGGTNGYERDTSGGAVPSFNGNRQQGNNYIMDGVEINETINNLVGYNPAPEAIGEMRTVTANADAEYGDVNGGEILMVTKSGTNNFHGALYEYFENQDLDRQPLEQQLLGIPKGIFHQDLFGVTGGGPIFKNKLFFFGGLRRRPQQRQRHRSASVATVKMRTGDFSELLTIRGIQLYNPAVSGTNPTGGTAAATPYNEQPDPG